MFRAGRFRRWGWKWWTCGNGGLSDFHEAPRKSSPIAFGLSVRILISSIAAMPDLRRRVTALRSAAAAIGWRARPLLRNQFLQAVSGCVNGTRRHKPLSNLWWCHGVPMVRIRFAPAVAGPAHISAARRMSALAESDGSSAFRAVSAPQTGSVAASISPSCASTEAWSQ